MSQELWSVYTKNGPSGLYEALNHDVTSGQMNGLGRDNSPVSCQVLQGPVTGVCGATEVHREGCENISCGCLCSVGLIESQYTMQARLG